MNIEDEKNRESHLMAYATGRDGERVSKLATEAEVMAIPEPAFTKSWHPLGHAKILRALGYAVKQTGLQIRDKKYSLSKDGGNMFGVWNLMQEESGQLAWAMGIRNSIKKVFAVGICAGNHVFVCDNLAFYGDFVEFRKHTNQLDMDELYSIADRAVDGVIEKMDVVTKWHLSLKEANIDEQTFKALTFDAMQGSVFPPSQFKGFVQNYQDENEIAADHAETLYAFHGAATRTMRNASLFQVSNRSRALTTTLDTYLDEQVQPEEKVDQPSGLKKTLNKIGLSVF